MPDNEIEYRRHFGSQPMAPPSLPPPTGVFTGSPNPGIRDVHVHHHHYPAAPQAESAPQQQQEGRGVLDRYAPYFVLLLGGVVILVLVAVVLVILTPVLQAILESLVALVIAVAVCCGMLALLGLAISSGIRNMRETPRPQKKGKRT